MSRLTELVTPLVAMVVAATPAAAQRPGIRYFATTGDSIEIIGLFPMAIGESDSAFVMLYRTFLPPGDTADARREALPWWPWFVAQMRDGDYHKAAIWVLWAKAEGDSLLEQGPRTAFAIQFAKDPRDCWRVVNDTTPIQNCARDSTTAGPPH